MKILIAGANGLLGKKLVEGLSQENEVYAITRPDSTFNMVGKNIKVLEIDLSTLQEKDLPKNIDVIYYLAQSRRFREFPEGTQDMLNINILAPIKFVEWAVKNNVRKFVYTSSGGVYRNPQEPVKEFFNIDANEKIGFYLSSKLSAEILLKNFSHFFETFILARPFFIYGPGQEKTMLIPRLINNIHSSEEITLFGKEGLKLNPIYYKDAAKAFKKMLDMKGEHIINIAGDETISLKKLAELIGKVIHKKPKFKVIGEEKTNLIADTTLMKSSLHSPKVNLEKGISRTASYMGIMSEPISS